MFQDLGMNMSLTRYCAIYRHEAQQEKLKSVVLTGLIFSIFTALIISGLMYTFAGPIASVYLNHPEVEPLVRAASLSVLGGGGLVTTIQAVFIGYEIMSLSSLLQVSWTILRTVFSVILILSGFGAFGAVLAYTSSQVVAGLIGLVLLFMYIKFKPNSSEVFSFKMLKTFLSYGLPLSASNLLKGILAQIYNVIMVLYIATDLIGNYGAALNFGVLVSFLTVPIATTLFPLYSKFKQGDLRIKAIFQMAVKYTSMITLPVVLAIIAISTPLSRVLYGTEDYPYVPLYLSIYILVFAWEGFGGVSLERLISGIGESTVTLRANILTFITGIILALILVPRFGIVGLLVTIVFDGRGGWIYQLLWVKKKLGITVDWGSTARIYLVGLSAFAVTFLLINILNLLGLIALVVGGFTYLLVYVVGLPLSGAFKQSDLKQLDSIIDTLGPLVPVAHWLLNLMGRITRE
jgi:O-antigen/teichoic acid export membrane protein